LWQDGSVPYDRLVDNDELEWIASNPDNVRVTGLMLKTELADPELQIQKKYETHKEILAGRKSRITKPGKWEFVNRGNFVKYSQSLNDSIERAFANGLEAIWLGTQETRLPKGAWVNIDSDTQITCENNKKSDVRRVEIPV